MKTLTVTNRNGEWLDTIRVKSDPNKSTPHERAERQRIVEKYAGNCYIFSAEPSSEVSTSPARIPSPRRFSLHD